MPTPYNANSGILPNIGAFISNAGENTKQIANGILGAPKMVQDDMTKLQDAAKKGDHDTVGAIMNKYKPDTALGGMVISFAKSLYKDLGSPMQGGDIVGRAEQNAFQSPVSVGLDALSFMPGVKALRGAGTAGEVADATNVASKTAENVAPATETAAQMPKITPKKNTMVTQNVAPVDQVASYNSAFQVPRNVAQNMKMKPQKIISQLIEDGVTGKSLDELEQVAGSVTGSDGAFAKINRTMLSDIKDPVDYSVATEAVDPAINKFLKGSKAGLINEVKTRIQRALPGYQVEGELPNAMPENHALATDLFDSAQELGDLQRMYERKATSAMGDLINPDYERAANAIKEVKDNIQDVLDKKIPPEVYQSYKSDPRILEELKRVPPAVAKRWIENAKQFRDGRAIQAPYVGLQKMIDHTKDSQLSAATKLMGKMGDQTLPRSERWVDNARAWGSHPVINTVAPVAKKVLSPFVDETPLTADDITRQQTAGSSAQLNVGVGKLQGQTGNSLRQGLSLPLEASSVSVRNNNPENPEGGHDQNPNNEQINNNGNHGSILPQSDTNVNNQPYSAIKPDPSTKLYELPQSAPEGQNQRHYMGPQDYQGALAKLAATYTAGTPTYNSQKTLLDAQYAADQQQADEVFKGNNVKNFMDNATQYNADGKDLYSTLHDLPPGFWNGVKQVGSVRAYTDPQYQQQLTQIDNFNNEFASAYESVTGKAPTDNQLLSSANSPEQAAKKYAYMMQFISGTYGKYVGPYLALTSATGTQTAVGSPQPLNYQPAPPAQTTDFSAMKQTGVPDNLTSLPPIQ